MTKAPPVNAPRSIAEIDAMGRPELIAAWSQVMGTSPPRKLSMPFLRRFLAFEIQARQKGGFPTALAKRLDVAGARPRAARERRSPALMPGARLLREWNGVTHVVDVTAEGFTWQGRTWRSLSAIAREITGARWSGPRFFGLKGKAAS